LSRHLAKLLDNVRIIYTSVPVPLMNHLIPWYHEHYLLAES